MSEVMPSMLRRNSLKKKSKAGQPPWTDLALIQQMSGVKLLLERLPVDMKNLSNQCLLLSKILDSLVANNRKPNYRQELIPLVKQVCKYKDKPEARPALLVLLLSVKSAFRTDWLSSLEVTEKDEIFTTLNSLILFTTCDEVSAQAPFQPLQCGGSAVNDGHEVVIYLASIGSRFLPRLQINSVFAAVQAKVGYEVLMCDFHVPHMHILDRVRLYACKKDSMETASCLITPPQVNILVNGQQVEKRVTTGYLDVGPQMPTDVTGMVRVGANVLQIIGEFSVSYVIAVASSRTVECSAKNTHLEDYVAPTKAASSEVDPPEVDDEVVEGASRLSLRCPISHQRLVTPVKATTCRHLQCFDYDCFLEINEKRPAWRCPCCNRFISWPDLRIDRQMEKVLKETDEKIHEVIISQDGSWVPVSIGEDQSNSGIDVIPVEGGEGGSEVIYLSDIADEEPKGIRCNRNGFEQPERKPDLQTLLAINDHPGTPLQTTNRVVGQQDALEQPGAINVPDVTAVAPQSFAGPSWAGPSHNDGTLLNVDGSALYTPTTGTVDNQPAPLPRSLPINNHNFQGPYSHSRTGLHLNSTVGPINRSAPSSGYMTSAPLQQPQIGVPSNIAMVTREETGWVWQRQLGQQSSGNPQSGQPRQQWRGPAVSIHQQQPATNTAHLHNLQPLQQAYFSQSPVSHPPHQTPSPGINTQQMPRAWGGPPSVQWPSGSGNSAQVPGGPSTLEQNWRPAGRMRGSVTTPPAGHGVLGSSPTAAQQRGSSGYIFPPIAHSFNLSTSVSPQENAAQYQLRMPTSGNFPTMSPFTMRPRG